MFPPDRHRKHTQASSLRGSVSGGRAEALPFVVQARVVYDRCVAQGRARQGGARSEPCCRTLRGTREARPRGPWLHVIKKKFPTMYISSCFYILQRFYIGKSCLTYGAKLYPVFTNQPSTERKHNENINFQLAGQIKFLF